MHPPEIEQILDRIFRSERMARPDAVDLRRYMNERIRELERRNYALQIENETLRRDRDLLLHDSLQHDDWDFYDDEGRVRTLTWVEGDESVNIPSGYCLVPLEDAA